MKKLILIIGIISLTIFFSSCKNKKTKDFDFGFIENNKYINSYFNFEVILPSDWVIHTKKQTEKLMESSFKKYTGDNEIFKTAKKSKAISAANLISANKYNEDDEFVFNPGFVIYAENLGNITDINTGKDYLIFSREYMKMSELPIVCIDEDFEKKSIDNQEFYIMNITFEQFGLKSRQTFYSTIKNNFCLTAVISYFNDEQKNELEKVIDSIKFIY